MFFPQVCAYVMDDWPLVLLFHRQLSQTRSAKSETMLLHVMAAVWQAYVHIASWIKLTKSALHFNSNKKTRNHAYLKAT